MFFRKFPSESQMKLRAFDGSSSLGKKYGPGRSRKNMKTCQIFDFHIQGSVWKKSKKRENIDKYGFYQISPFLKEPLLSQANIQDHTNI